MLYLVWVPADPEAVAALVPEELEPAENCAVYLNQYVVDDAAQTSNAGDPNGFGAYSLTYLGVDLAGLDTSDGTPGRWWTHYFNSSKPMIAYATAAGIPAGGGETELTLEGDAVTATSLVDGTPIIRTTARARVGEPVRTNGQLRYITRLDGELRSGRYPFVADLAEEFEVSSLEFLAPQHDVYALRPVEPLEITFKFYSPSISFCYPGGEGLLGSAAGS